MHVVQMAHLLVVISMTIRSLIVDAIVFVLMQIVASHTGISVGVHQDDMWFRTEEASVARVALVVLDPEDIHATLPGLMVMRLLVDACLVRMIALLLLSCQFLD